MQKGFGTGWNVAVASAAADVVHVSSENINITKRNIEACEEVCVEVGAK
jgi:hypothetical protein